MRLQSLEIEDFIKKLLYKGPSSREKISPLSFRVHEGLKTIDAVKLNFHLVILCCKGTCEISVGYHNFVIESSSISIIPPHTVVSFKYFSPDFDAHFLIFKSDFIKKGFMKNDITEELLVINPDYPPIFVVAEKVFDDTLYKFKKIQEEIENQAPFCIKVARLYILQILYEYNRTCEICLLNSEKVINRQYQVMYEFRKLVDKNFHKLKTVKEYASLMFLSAKYVSECIKNQTGESALSIIQNRIILEADFLLNYSELSIKSISDKLGFISTSAFSRFFKQIKGISPDKYRNKQKY